MQDSPNSSYQKLCKFSDLLYKAMNFICVVSLWIELFSVTVMVVGRYIFNHVPLWCDQLSTMALIWMSIISITLALYDESHMRVELIDKAVGEKGVNVLKYISNAVITAFSGLMVYHGLEMVKLTAKTKLSGFRVSSALLYVPLIICGVVSIYMSIFCVIRRIKEAKQ